MNDQEGARKATIGAYARRFDLPFSMQETPYTGDFDYKATAAQALMPESADLAEHRHCWSEMLMQFSRDWLTHLQSKSIGSPARQPNMGAR